MSHAANELALGQPAKNFSKILPWLIWATTATFYFYQFILRVSPSVITEDLMRDLSIQACTLGTVASFYYYGYTCMQLPVGLILDHIGIRLPLTCAVVLCSLGCLIFATTSSLVLMSLGRLIMGIGSAFGFLSCIKAATLWFPVSRLNLLIGLTIMLGTTGGTSGGAPFAGLVAAIGWRSALLVLAALGAILAGVAWIIVRAPADAADKNKESDKKVSLQSVWNSTWMILKNPQTWLFGAYGSLMYMPLSSFADLWGPAYVAHAYDQERATAAGAVSLIYIGIAAGSPFGAWMVNTFKSHRQPLLWSALLSSIVLTATIYLPHYLPFSWTYPLFFLIGACLSAQFLAFAGVCTINPRELSSTASGVHNMLCMLSGVIFQPVIGYLLDYSRAGQMLGGVAHYSTKDYFFALSVLPISTVLAIVCTWFMKETYVPEEA